MRFNSQDVAKVMKLYENVTNMGYGAPAAVTVPAPGDNASGGSGKLKGPAPGHQSTVGGPGSEANEEEYKNCEQKQMSMTNLLVCVENVLDIVQQLQNEREIEPWAAEKIAIASDYIQTVANYLKFGGEKEKTSISIVPIEFETDIIPSVTEAKATKQRLDPKCWSGYRKAGTKVKGGIRVNKCVKVKK